VIFRLYSAAAYRYIGLNAKEISGYR